jgi:hypothetical protein
MDDFSYFGKKFSILWPDKHLFWKKVGKTGKFSMGTIAYS